VQTQSYGSEARGGECQAELILSAEPINSPSAGTVDLLVVLSQPALERYLPRLKSNGTAVIDPRYVDRPNRTGIRIIEVPVTKIAVEEIGQQITANMVMLGFLREATNLMSKEVLLKAIRESVPERFVEINLKAAERGRQLALEEGIGVEV
jgi:2-oxoglutarate ferredoxin oxidoreductase subunit gamma